MVVKDIEREDVEFISKTIGAIPVAHIDNLTPEKLGKAENCGEEKLSDDTNIFKITGV
jgi:T-complex protein 1 subunit delta